MPSWLAMAGMSPPAGAADAARPTPGQRSFWRGHPWLSGVLGVLGLWLVVIVVVLFTPLLDRPIAVDADPAASYDDAVALAGELQAADAAGVNPLCRSQVIDQGQRTEKAVVLLHGYTNCPRQFSAIAQAYADAGYSVVVPRLPGHGEADRLTTALSDINPAALTETGDLAVDIAAGLGQDVMVVGLSGGGTLAGWLASERDEVTEAVLIAPLVVPKVVPEVAVAPLARAARFIPDVFLWWDSDLQEALDDPPYAYPRFSLRSLGAFLAIGRDTQTTEPGRETPLERLVVVVNENDAAVSNAGVYDVERQLEQLLPLDVEGVDRIDYVFAAEAGYKHDVIDPEGENAENLDEIYPVLGPLLGLDDLTAPH
jgi:pimeloyl-ACP methyl ester carboxylesterase